MNKGKGLFKLLRLDKIDDEKKEKLVIMFLSGVFLLLIAAPVSDVSKNTGHKKAKMTDNDTTIVSKPNNKNQTNNAYLTYLENKLEQTIGGMDGAGKVLVMITLKDGGEKILDKNRPYESRSDKNVESGKESDSQNIKSDQETVLIEQDGNTGPIIVKEQYPGIEGVVVLCEGGNDKELSVKIKEAVSALFSVPTHKIVVGKLRS